MIDFGFVEWILAIALAWVVFAVVQDFKQREIANWLNFSLIIFALVFRIFYSVFSGNYNFIIFGIAGVVAFYILGHLFYYTRFFAGGDAKLFIGLGAVVLIASTWYENLLIAIVFLMSLFLFGGIYSIGYSGVVAFRNRKEFRKEFVREFYKNEKYAFIALIFVVIFMLLAFFINDIEIALFVFFIAFMVFLLPVIYFYTRAVEKCCMMKNVDVSELTVGDWIVDNVKVKIREGRKMREVVIEPNWEGLSEEELDVLQKNYKGKVLVKYGVPFSPSFLLALLAVIAVKYFFNANFGLWF